MIQFGGSSLWIRSWGLGVFLFGFGFAKIYFGNDRKKKQRFFINFERFIGKYFSIFWDSSLQFCLLLPWLLVTEGVTGVWLVFGAPFIFLHYFSPKSIDIRLIFRVVPPSSDIKIIRLWSKRKYFFEIYRINNISYKQFIGYCDLGVGR